MGFTFYQAPRIENPVIRYACAGTAATLFQEISMHAIDTLNMRAKVINGNKIYVLELIRQEGIMCLSRGIQPVLYGYILSSYIYFYTYAVSKSKMRKGMKSEENSQQQLVTADSEASNSNLKAEEQQANTVVQNEKQSPDYKGALIKTLIITFASSIIAEQLTLTLYYPFDLIKTRMQVDYLKYGYKGTLDAFIKVYQEKKSALFPSKPWLQKVFQIKNFYNGIVLYSLSYTFFVALQFSIFESLLLFVENYRQDKILRNLNLASHYDNKIPSGQTEVHHANIQSKDHSKIDIAVCSFTAGVFAGFLTNPIEFLAVNRQTNENFSIRQALKQKGIFYDMMFKGNTYRCIYNGCSAMMFFLLFQELCLPLNVDITMYDE
eukprot:403345020